MPSTNPYSSLASRSKWGDIGVDNRNGKGTKFPGIVVSIDGLERPIEWTTQYVLGTNGAGKLFKGRKLVDGAKIRCSLPNALYYAQCEEFIADYVLTPPGQRAKSHTIDNPAFATIKMTKFVFDKESAPIPIGNGSWEVTFYISEYEKMTTAPLGQPDPAKIDDPPKPEDAQAERLKVAVDLLMTSLEPKK